MPFNSSMKILIVDESGASKQAIRKMLTNIGFKNIITAASAEIAWEKITEDHTSNTPVEFIISDWVLPKMSGVDFLKQVRSSSTAPKIPFLILMDDTSQDKVLMAVQSGVSNLLTKPFSSNSLIEKVSIIFNKNKAA